MPEALNLGRLALPPTTALFCPITGFPAESEMLMRNLVVTSALFGVHTSVLQMSLSGPPHSRSPS